ncbi:hypothetical protein CMUS01_02302 [Colletotrichum musicola]|uniref:Uncharacterized protein n=1 Tax=Colletotrichum musicola TaxID=2175873 RepID=A0A8H6NVD9_9PEZI|nr:hypothetical protein CMUS01_02302 [Colletotrichum musicola]
MWLFAIPLVKLTLGWAFSLFGFGPLGPIAGTAATAWQATYMGTEQTSTEHATAMNPRRFVVGLGLGLLFCYPLVYRLNRPSNPKLQSLLRLFLSSSRPLVNRFLALELRDKDGGVRYETGRDRGQDCERSSIDRQTRVDTAGNRQRPAENITMSPNGHETSSPLFGDVQ